MQYFHKLAAAVSFACFIPVVAFAAVGSAPTLNKNSFDEAVTCNPNTPGQALNSTTWTEGFNTATANESGAEFTMSPLSTQARVYFGFAGLAGSNEPVQTWNTGSFTAGDASKVIDARICYRVAIKRNVTNRGGWAFYYKAVAPGTNIQALGSWWNDSLVAGTDQWPLVAGFVPFTGERLYTYQFDNMGSFEQVNVTTPYKDNWIIAAADGPNFASTSFSSTWDTSYMRFHAPGEDLVLSWDDTDFGDSRVVLWVTPTASKNDGFPINLVENTGSYAFDTGALPPGTYRAYFMSADENEETALSAAFTINDKPNVQLDLTQNAAEYFTDLVNNPADMNDSADIQNTAGAPGYLNQFSSPQFLNGIFSAFTSGPWAGPENDPRFELNTAAPIHTNRFHYLSYQYDTDMIAAGYNTHSNIGLGDLANIVAYDDDRNNVGGRFTPAGHLLAFTYAGKDAPIYEMDLAAISNDYNQAPQGNSWDSLGVAHNIFFHGHEGPYAGNLMRLYDVKLYEDPRALRNSSGQHQLTVSFDIQDDSGGSFSASFYYGASNTGPWNLIGSQTGLSTGANSYDAVLPGSLAKGSEQFLRVVVTDNGGLSGEEIHYKKFIVGKYERPSFGNVPFDYDGDGMGNAIVYRPSTGQVILTNANGSYKAFTIAGSTTYGNEHKLMTGDFNGDGRMDAAILLKDANSLGSGVHGIEWYILWDMHKATSRAMRYDFGYHSVPSTNYKGDLPVVGDFMNKGYDQIGVYRWESGKATFYIRDPWSDEDLIQTWGLPGDLPVAADYDGDGITDFAIWRPSTGEWIQKNSSAATDPGRHAIEVHQWGGNVDQIPFGACFVNNTGSEVGNPSLADEGNCKADRAIFDPSNGTWWILPFGNDRDFTVDGGTDTAFYTGDFNTPYMGMFWGLTWSPHGDVPKISNMTGSITGAPSIFRQGGASASTVWAGWQIDFRVAFFKELAGFVMTRAGQYGDIPSLDFPFQAGRDRWSILSHQDN